MRKIVQPREITNTISPLDKSRSQERMENLISKRDLEHTNGEQIPMEIDTPEPLEKEKWEPFWEGSNSND